MKTSIEIVNDELVINSPRLGDTYNIELSRINSEAATIKWIMHLTQKAWFGIEELRMFIEIVAKNKGFKLYGT